MLHRIEVIRDDQLPDGVDWALVECQDTGREIFFVKESAVGDPRVMADGWAAYRKLDSRYTPCRRYHNKGNVTYLPLVGA